MKYIKVFDTTEQYLRTKPYLSLFHICACKDNVLESQVSPYNESLLIAKYNVTSTSNAIKLYDKSSFSKMMIDGIEQSQLIDSYTFDTLGEHTVIYVLSNPTNIKNETFFECFNLSSINILNGVVNIGVSAFYNCWALKSINIPKSITNIENYAFEHCYLLSSIILPDNITTIGTEAFYNCYTLKSITIGNNITNIGSKAFKSCSSLTSITCNAITAPTIVADTFQNISSNGTLTVPSDATGYDTWMETGNYYLGKYNWTKVEQ